MVWLESMKYVNVDVTWNDCEEVRTFVDGETMTSQKIIKTI